MYIRRQTGHNQTKEAAMRLVIFVTVSLLATPLLAASQSQTKQAEELEAKIKQPCVPRLEERPETPLDYRRCGEGKMVGTDAWYRCTSELERLHRAVFFWNLFVERCAKEK